MINFIGAIRIIVPFLFPSVLSIVTHYLCDYIGCNEWYSLLGYNLACNACIDSKKVIKDHQVTMYWSIGSFILSKMNTFINSEIFSQIE